MANELEVRFLPRRMEGDIQVAQIFNADGSPFDVNVGKKVEPWLTVADVDLNNGWVKYGPGYDVKFRRRPDGDIELQGRIKSGVAGRLFFLPLTYNPLDTGPDDMWIFPVAASGGKVLQVSVQTDRQVIISGDLTGVDWVSLSGVRFPTD